MAKIKGKNLSASAHILYDPQTCTGCGLCELMCSLYHEGEQGQALSRAELVGDRLTAEFIFNVCQQCPSPSCYNACLLKDKALCIDEVTGVKYINAEECDGCGKCIEACPYNPPRINLHPEKNAALMCDLCRGRVEGPICVEYCSFDSLTYAGKEER
ncbi:MAG: 4Fe-4S dicluster domain-containing protein [Dehalococcoidales bacterium]|nr:4Fe-4S dicluster domain-containing protein [Dehalococcoidales bacterium]